MKEVDTGGTCSTHGGGEGCLQGFGWMVRRQETTGKMDLREMGIDGANWIHLAQVRGPVAGFCEHGDKPSSSIRKQDNFWQDE